MSDFSEEGAEIIKDALNRTARSRAEQFLAAIEREKAEQRHSGEYREEDWDE